MRVKRRPKAAKTKKSDMIKQFNDGWEFAKEGGEYAPVELPHDAMIAEKRYASCRNASQSGYFPGGKYRYRKKFELTADEAEKKVGLLFEGVYRNCEVYVNGSLAGAHKYGYGEFTVDIGSFVRGGVNLVEVTVDNSLVPNCRWYSGSGIYRPVSLIVEGEKAPSEPQVHTISIDPAIVRVTADDDAQIKLLRSKTVVAEGAPGDFVIENAQLWSAESPELYTCVATRGKESKSVTFGIRKLEWSGREGLVINGRQVKLRGGCIHHDNGVLGACGFAAAEERRVRILKEQGFNALRISHNPASRALLDACDRLGMYVMDEAFDGWYIPKDYHDFSRDFEECRSAELAAMVKKDFNHPCVIMYSLGNEITESAEEKGIKLCAEMRDLLHALDPTRPVTAGINVLLDVYARMGIGVYKDKGKYEKKPLPEGKGYKEKKTGSAFFNYWTQKLGGLMFALSKGKTAEKVTADIAKSLDIVGLNYASSRYDIDAEKYPDRLMAGTETMASALPYNWERVKRYPQLVGDFVWSAWDYLGETCMGWTYNSYKGLPLLANQGMIDITGLPLASMAFMRTVWGLESKPCIFVRPLDHAKETPSKGAWQFTDALKSWNWRGYEGEKAVVEIYSAAPRVRLEQNGKTIKEKKVKNFKALFKVTYMPGKLTAVALDENGAEISRSSLSSGCGEMRLIALPEKTVLTANGQDLAFVPIEFCDETGLLLPAIERRITLEVEGGAAKLIGFGSALYKTDETFGKNYHDSYRGRALAVFRATRKEGKITVTARAEGVPCAKFEIEVKK